MRRTLTDAERRWAETLRGYDEAEQCRAGERYARYHARASHVNGASRIGLHVPTV